MKAPASTSSPASKKKQSSQLTNTRSAQKTTPSKSKATLASSPTADKLAKKTTPSKSKAALAPSPTADKLVQKTTPSKSKAALASSPTADKLVQKTTPSKSKAALASSPTADKLAKKITPSKSKSALASSPTADKLAQKTTPSKSKSALASSPVADKLAKKSTPSKSKAALASSQAADKLAQKTTPSKSKAALASSLASTQMLNEQVKAIVPSDGIEEQFQGITLLNKAERDEVMRLLQEQNPNPKSELIYHNNFELLCAVVLSAQATDVSVNKATPALFAAAPDAQSMAALGAEGIAPFIQSIGLWKNKAKFLAQLSEQLVVQYQGQVPDSFEKLTALPGVGSKTAKVVLNVAFGQPCIAVDTHIYRVANRTGLCLGKSPSQVEERISSLIAEPYLKDAHHYLLLHGRYNCTAQRFESHCAHCVLAKYCKRNCDFKNK